MEIGQYLTGVSGQGKGTYNFAGIASGTFDRSVKTMVRYVTAVVNEFFRNKNSRYRRVARCSCANGKREQRLRAKHVWRLW